MADWAYDSTARRYRDRVSGRFLSATEMAEIRDDLQARLRAGVRDLTERLADGRLTVQQWERAMQAQIKQVHALEYAFGRGGRKQMTADDWRELGHVVREQWAYLRNFAQHVATGQMTAGQIAARAGMYLNATTTSYEQGRGAAFGIRLPAYPGQGSECLSQCHCRWVIAETETQWHATWTLGAAEHCDTCRVRAGTWAPLVIQRSGLRVVA